ncbi:MAG: gluconate transporter [Chitinophagaceae bacterium]|nr:gluconate transporter [Chitinophagaceae bacterium]
MQLLIILLAIVIQIILTVKKVHPFLSLLIVAVLAGLCLGMSPEALVKTVETGAGTTLGGIVFVFCLGAALGKVLEKNGAIQCIAQSLINAFGNKGVQWAVMLTGFITGIPLFYNAGFILLVPLIFTLARRSGTPLLMLAIPMAASLSVTHCFLPPHPGPVVLVKALHADMGKTLLYGLMIAIPVVILAGPVLAGFLRKINPVKTVHKDEAINTDMPSAWLSFLLALLPVLLITTALLMNHFYAYDDVLRRTLLFTGDPVIALLISLCIAVVYTLISTKNSMAEIMLWIQSSISGIVMILLIITAGGVFKQVITDSGTAKTIADYSLQWNIPPLLFAWLVTAFLRVMVGSATVAGLTAAGIVAPLLATGNVSPELLVLAVGTGSVFGSHVNDSGFWMFREFFGLSLKQTFMSWTLMESLISVLGLVGVLILNAFV